MLLRYRMFPKLRLPAARRLLPVAALVCAAIIVLTARPVAAQEAPAQAAGDTAAIEETTTTTESITTETAASTEESRRIRRLENDARRAFARDDLDRLREALDELRVLDPENPLIVLYGEALEATEVDPEVLEMLDFPRPDLTKTETVAAPDAADAVAPETDRGPSIREQLGMGPAVTGPVPGGAGPRAPGAAPQAQGGIMDKIKSQPLWVWIVVVVVIVLLVAYFRRRGGEAPAEAAGAEEAEAVHTSTDDILEGAGALGAVGAGLDEDISFSPSLEDEEEAGEQETLLPGTDEEELGDVSLFGDLDSPSAPSTAPKPQGGVDDTDLGLDLSDINLFEDETGGGDESDEEGEGEDKKPTSLDELENPLDFDDDDRT